MVKIGSVTAEIFLILTNVTWTNVAWTNVTATVEICSKYIPEHTFKVSSKFSQQQMRYSWYGQMSMKYSWYGQMSSGQILPGQMLLQQLKSVQDSHKNLPLKFCQKRFYDKKFFRQKFFYQNFFGKFFLMKFFINFTVTVGICLRWSQGPTFKVWSTSGQWQLRYSWYGQMSLGQMLPEKMS